MKSLENKHFELAEMLLTKKPDVTTITRWKINVMHVAAQYGSARLIKLLSDTHKCPIDSQTIEKRQPVHYAAWSGNPPAMEELILRKVDLGSKDEFGCTPLLVAAAMGHTNIIKRLLWADVDVNCSDVRGCTVFHFLASRHAALAAVDALLEKGAKVGKANAHGRLALHEAAHFSNRPMVNRLLARGEEPNHMDIFQFTPIDNAAASHDVVSVQKMIEHGGTLNHLDGYGRTPLYWLRQIDPDITTQFPGVEEPIALEGEVFERHISSLALGARYRILQTQNLEDAYASVILANCLGFLGDAEGAAIVYEQGIWHQGNEVRYRAVCECDFGHHEIKGKRMFCLSCVNCDFCYEHWKEYKEKNIKVRGCQGHQFVQVPRDVYSTLKAGMVNDQGQDRRAWLESLDFESR